MAKYSSAHEQGVASISRERVAPQQQILFPASPLDDLKAELMSRYSGRRMTFEALIRDNSPGTRFEESTAGCSPAGPTTTFPLRGRRHGENSPLVPPATRHSRTSHRCALPRMTSRR